MDTPASAPMLLLHGFPLTAAMWRHTLARFGGTREAVAPEAESLARDCMDEPSMTALASAAAAALDAHGIQRPAVIVGLSMGGYIALELARLHPRRVAALILCDTRCSADTPEARANRNSMIEAVRTSGVEEGVAPLVSRLLGPAAPEDAVQQIRAMVRDNRPDVVTALIKALRDRRDNCAVLDGFGEPGLAVRGEDDALAPRDVTEDMASRMARGSMVEIPRAGHVPPLEAPDAFNAALEAFLTEHNL